MSTLFTGAMFGTAATDNIFSGRQTLSHMLRFESALATTEAAAGVIPQAAAEVIRRVCATDDWIDNGKLTHDAVPAGNVAIPLVKQLTAAVAVADEDAAKYVHWGATSQDVIDTALVLQLRDAFMQILHDIDALADTIATLTDAHAYTPMPGRTLLQQALPVTFGFKTAGWLDALMRHRERWSGLAETVTVLQFGGAVGTLSSLGDAAHPVATGLARELDLTLPEMPWHTHRDRIAEVATTCGLLVGTLGKIAADIALETQTEVGELAEPAAPGKGGSSTLPHKRNLVSCTYVVAAAMRMPNLVATMLATMAHEHERAAGCWHAEWEVMPEILRVTGGALSNLTQVTCALEVYPQRMQANLDITCGQLLAEAVTIALGPKLGRMRAYQLVQQACQRAAAANRPLGEELLQDPVLKTALTPDDVQGLLQPSNYLGQSSVLALRVLQQYRDRVQQQRPA